MSGMNNMRGSMKRFLPVLLLLLATSGRAQLKEGTQAPSFFLKTNTGESFFLSRVVGPKAKANLKQPVVLSFFATWCVPCKKEIPQLEILQKAYPGVGIYLVDVNEEGDLVAEYVKKFDVKLPILLDRYGKVSEKYSVVNDQGIGNLPTLVIISAEGEIVLYHVGYKEGDEKTYENIIKDLISKQQS